MMSFQGNHGYVDVKIKLSREALNHASEDSPIARLIRAIRTAVADFDQAMTRDPSSLIHSQDPNSDEHHTRDSARSAGGALGN